MINVKLLEVGKFKKKRIQSKVSNAAEKSKRIRT